MKEKDICKSRCAFYDGCFKDHKGQKRNSCKRDKFDNVMHSVPAPLESCPYYRQIPAEKKRKKTDD